MLPGNTTEMSMAHGCNVAKNEARHRSVTSLSSNTAATTMVTLAAALPTKNETCDRRVATAKNISSDS